MAVRNYVLWGMALFVLTGCGSAFKAKWRNFNAYYNTYYNAQKNYQAGVKKNLGQAREYNPLQPIRIHPKPVNAGAQDFEKAIQKGADVLRRHSESKWVDDALALIGKSYYFKREYFSADQKFRELALTTQNKQLKQEAVLWRSRVLLDMESYSEGVAYLTEEISLHEDLWERSYLSEANALLAQHYVALENWQIASELLTEAIPGLSSKAYKERAYFLLGQLQERLGNEEAAYGAYNSVQKYYVEYQLQYLAQRKMAEVARSLGRNDIAYRIFSDMVRDDKNLEFKAELDYELARTEHERNNFKRAEVLYKQVLHDNLMRPSPEIQARSYYGLAEIYRFQYDNFSMAAAYYDSAAQKKVPLENLPSDFRASELAESFGTYSRIKALIAREDSLLKLGKMSPDELETVLAEIRAQRLSELQQKREQEEARKNQLVTVNNKGDSDNSGTVKNGFLNENNPVIQENIRRQFKAVWGNRPLADNWRVRSMINSAPANLTDIDNNNAADTNTGSELVTIELDLSDVPFSASAQDSVQKLIAGHQYELGNLFYLSLNLPDSAAHYFKKTISGPSDNNIRLLSLYSLSELYSAQGVDSEARRYAKQVLQEYPSTLYARRLASKLDLEYAFEDGPAMEDPVSRYEQIRQADSASYVSKARDLLDLSEDHPEHSIAPLAHYEAIQYYMKAGANDSAYTAGIARWDALKNEKRQQVEAFRIQQDSARVMLNDSTLAPDQRSNFQSLVDSTLSISVDAELFPYKGEIWDQARAAIDSFIERYESSELLSRVIRIQEELRRPNNAIVGVQPVAEPDPVAQTPSSGYLSCQDIRQELEIRGGMQRFLANVSYKKKFTADDSLTYSFKVNRRGIPESYELQSKGYDRTVISAFESEFNRGLTFEPMLYEGQAVAVECSLSFPLGN